MKRPEREPPLRHALRRVHLAAAFVLCVAGPAGPVHAKGFVTATELQTTQTVAPANPMPGAFDGLPCVRCYQALAPTVQGFTRKSEAPKQAAWHQLPNPLMTEKHLDLPKREESVPLRVAYCRWRN